MGKIMEIDLVNGQGKSFHLVIMERFTEIAYGFMLVLEGKQRLQ